ncbi:uncharacterized protein LOC143475606 [Brachyhypopomus gauderio]|uniref:uncharacterized protein LOC143475606 n=1 Tax=Brachyhypopomus gauderio TaxID=698409 RepID=UPI004041B200
MYFLNTILEVSELESSLDGADASELGREELARHSSHVPRTSQHVSIPEAHETSLVLSLEQEGPGQSQTHGCRLPSSGSATETVEVNVEQSDQDSEVPSTQRRSRREMQPSPPGQAVRRRYSTRERTRKESPRPPPWLINLMFDIEAATKHELTVE